MLILDASAYAPLLALMKLLWISYRFMWFDVNLSLLSLHGLFCRAVALPLAGTPPMGIGLLSHP
jgi:hypothetical protein